MNAWRKIIFDTKSISWILVLSILSITLVPAHYDLHYLSSNESSLHETVVDLHLLTVTAGKSQQDNDATFFEASPKVIMKQSEAMFSPLIIHVVTMLLLRSEGNRIRYKTSENYTHPVLRYFYFTHQLRAPPLY